MTGGGRQEAGRGLMARALVGSALVGGSFAFAQGLRLASNLVLARLLFPEAFGVMALVSVMLVGLAMFSDMGVGPAISRSARGDEPDFLDTAFTLNVLRGLLLWALTMALGGVVARFYAVPELALYLPVAGIALALNGFWPTRVDTAQRHLLLARVTALDLASQAIGIAVMVALALATQSVWALVIGSVAGAAAKLALMWGLLPGRGNRLRWEPAAGRELIHFGKWIFLSTAAGFVLSQGDKAILGAHLTLEALGLYNIGWFLASFPVLLGGAVISKVMIPVYRDSPPAQSAANARRVARLRGVITAGMLVLLGAGALVGVPLVGLLYDARYAPAAAVLVAVVCVQLPGVIGMTYDSAALAAGDTRAFFVLSAVKAAVQTAGLLIGAAQGGLAGALIGQTAGLLLAYPAIVVLARRYGVWDARHDAFFGTVAVGLGMFALWWNSAALALLPA